MSVLSVTWQNFLIKCICIKKIPDIRLKKSFSSRNDYKFFRLYIFLHSKILKAWRINNKKKITTLPSIRFKYPKKERIKLSGKSREKWERKEVHSKSVSLLVEKREKKERKILILTTRRRRSKNVPIERKKKATTKR